MQKQEGSTAGAQFGCFVAAQAGSALRRVGGAYEQKNECKWTPARRISTNARCRNGSVVAVLSRPQDFSRGFADNGFAARNFGDKIVRIAPNSADVLTSTDGGNWGKGSGSTGSRNRGKWWRGNSDEGAGGSGEPSEPRRSEFAAVLSSSGALLKLHRALRWSPVITQAVLTSFVELLSEIISQVSKPPENGARVSRAFDWRRLAIVTMLGGLMVGPSYVVWFSLLSKLCSSCVGGTITKIVLDQLFFAFVFNYAYIAVMRRALPTQQQRAEKDTDGKSGVANSKVSSVWDSAADQTRRGWQFWPVVMLFTMTQVPYVLRPAIFKFAAFSWNVISSLANYGIRAADMLD